MSSELDRSTRILAMCCHLLMLPGQIIILPIAFFLTSAVLSSIGLGDRSSHDANFTLSLSIVFLMPLADFLLSTLVVFAVWKLNWHRDLFIDESGKESINCWMSMTGSLFAIDAITLASCGFPTFKTAATFSADLAWIAIGLNVILMLFVLCLIMLASIQTIQGRMYRYPFIVRFLS